MWAQLSCVRQGGPRAALELPPKQAGAVGTTKCNCARWYRRNADKQAACKVCQVTLRHQKGRSGQGAHVSQRVLFPAVAT